MEEYYKQQGYIIDSSYCWDDQDSFIDGYFVIGIGICKKLNT